MLSLLSPIPGIHLYFAFIAVSAEPIKTESPKHITESGIIITPVSTYALIFFVTVSAHCSLKAITEIL